MQVVGDAPDGRTALEIYQRERPDVLITDLRMPEINGIQLIETIRQTNRQIRIVILTCVEDFDLARRAMALGVSEYLPKLSMTSQDIGRSLQKLQTELQQSEAKGRDSFGKAERDTQREHVLKEYIFYRLHSDEKFASFLAENRIPLQPDRLLVCLLEIDEYDRMQSVFQDDKGDIIRISLLNVLDEILGNAHSGVAFHDTGRHYALLLNLEEHTNAPLLSPKLHMVTDSIQNALRIYFDVSVTFGVSSVSDGFASIREGYAQAKTALEQKYFQGCGQVYTNCPAEREAAFREQMDAVRTMPEIRRILADPEYREFSRRFTELLNRPVHTSGAARDFFIQTMQWMACHIDFVQICDFSDVTLRYIRTEEKSETLRESIDVFSAFWNEIVRHLSSGPVDTEISAALRYIREHYGQDLTLNDVASQVGLSAGYFSSLFKREIKVGFAEYLQQFRIENAKRLLLMTEKRSCEIAREVGFSENSYFCRVFKNVTGMSPGAFRSIGVEEHGK